jgi:hypothetical protein
VGDSLDRKPWVLIIVTGGPFPSYVRTIDFDDEAACRGAAKAMKFTFPHNLECICVPKGSE